MKNFLQPLSSLKCLKLPSKKQWAKFFIVLSKKEKYIFISFASIFIACSLILGVSFYFSRTKIQATQGGYFKEGIVGQPKFVNPLYLSTQDIDRDIVEVLFSGLMKYNENGKLIPDLAEGLEIKDEGKTFEFILKKAFWHDGKNLTSDDIFFTASLIQNPEYQSPLRIKLSGILVEPSSPSKIIFKLPKAYPGFLETLTFKILPKHIFKDISPNSLPFALISQELLIGSGPFKVSKISKNRSGLVKEIILKRNGSYHGTTAFLSEFSFVFFANEKELLRALSSKKINGAVLQEQKTVLFAKNHNLALPRYFALFFNLNKENDFQNKELRQALGLAINRQEIVDKVFQGRATLMYSPILPQFFELAQPSEDLQLNYNPSEANRILDELGFTLNQTTGKREKTKKTEPAFLFTKTLTLKSESKEVEKLQECLANFPDIYPEGEVSGYFGEKTKAAVMKFQEKYKDEILTPAGLTKATGDVKQMTREKLNAICFQQTPETMSFETSLTTSDKFPLVDMAEIIKKNLEAVGLNVKLEKISLTALQTEALNKRNFDILLFGEALGAIPDPFPFWHSSQKNYPGLNISGYASKQTDTLLEQAREATSEKARHENLEQFQAVLLNDLPAIFLTQPDLVYTISSKIKGFNITKITEPAKRFSTIENWYLKTKRVWK